MRASRLMAHPIYSTWVNVRTFGGGTCSLIASQLHEACRVDSLVGWGTGRDAATSLEELCRGLQIRAPRVRRQIARLTPVRQRVVARKPRA